MRRSCWLLALALGSLAVGAAHAEDAAARRLARKISVAFEGVPLSRAACEISRLADCPVVLDEYLGDSRREAITFEATDTPARKVLEAVADIACAVCVLDGHAAVITTRRRSLGHDVELAIHDIRDMTHGIVHFPPPEFPLPLWSADGRFSPGPISSTQAPADSMMSAGSAAELIMSRVAPQTWGADLGTSIEERFGRLVVMQTEKVHRIIADKLRDLRRALGVFVDIEVAAYLAAGDSIDAALGDDTASVFLDEAERRRVEKRLAALGARRIGSARTICSNRQRIHVVSGTLAPYVSDIDVSGSALDPIVACSLEGILVDLMPLAANDRRSVTLHIDIAFTEPNGSPRSHAVMTGPGRVLKSPGSGGRWSMSLEKDGKTSTVTAKPSYDVDVVLPGAARVQTPDHAVAYCRTTVRIPEGSTAAFIAPARKFRGRARGEVLFLIKPRALAPVEAMLQDRDAHERPRMSFTSGERSRRITAASGGPEELLAKPVSVKIDGASLSEAVDHLRERTGLKITVDKEVDRSGSRHDIALFCSDIPAGEAIRWVARQAGLWYEVGANGVVLGQMHVLMGRNVALRFYDLGDLVFRPRDTPGPELMLHEPTSRSAGCLTLIGNDGSMEEVTAESLAEMITCRVRPGSWAAELGTSIEERSGRLVVMQVPDVHREIEFLLDAFRRTDRKTVSIRVRAIRVGGSKAAEVFAHAEPDGMLQKRGIDVLEEIARAEPARRLGSARFTCFNGVRATSYGGRKTWYVADYEISGDSHDPVVRPLREGLCADVRPVLSGDGRSMLLELRLAYCERAGEDIPGFHALGSKDGRGNTVPTPGPVQQPRAALAQLKTTVRVRSGATVALSASSPVREPGADADEIVFLVTATSVTF